MLRDAYQTPKTSLQKEESGQKRIIDKYNFIGDEDYDFDRWGFENLNKRDTDVLEYSYFDQETL